VTVNGCLSVSVDLLILGFVAPLPGTGSQRRERRGPIERIMLLQGTMNRISFVYQIGTQAA
jgi:hypothetical protein